MSFVLFLNINIFLVSRYTFSVNTDLNFVFSFIKKIVEVQRRILMTTVIPYIVIKHKTFSIGIL